MRLREKIFFLFLTIFAGFVLFRLFYWQVIYSGVLRPIAKSQYERELEIPSLRGEILASDGMPLVTNQPAYLLYVLPRQLKENPGQIAKKIAPFLLKPKVSPEATEEVKVNDEKDMLREIQADLEGKLSQKDLFWVLLSRKAPKEKIDQINALGISGIGFEKDFSRFYPESSAAAHLLGFVGFNEAGQNTGYFGLEGYYDRELSGKSGRAKLEVDPAGRPILIGGFSVVEKQDGSKIQTTIDRTVQYIVERRLEKAVQRYGAKEGSVVVMDPKTGAILAMATYPNYYPAFYSQFDQKIFSNPVVSDAYEPGSTFKLIGMSAALNENEVKKDTKCKKCEGPRQIANYLIRTWNNKYFPDSTVSEILQHSDNVGMVEVAQKLGIDRFNKYIRAFGFGEKTDIDLQGEVKGQVRDRKDWKEIDLATASFGQGIAVTALQMVRAVSAIANGGELVKPYVVQKVIRQDKVFEVKPKVIRKVISPETAKTLTDMMVNALEKGEAKAFKPKGFIFAGKTGTAQIPVEGHYDPEKTIASFLGFGSPNDPKFVILVRFREPETSKFGSETAAPTFFEIAKDLYAYYGIAPK